jgi:hypothetical protein
MNLIGYGRIKRIEETIYHDAIRGVFPGMPRSIDVCEVSFLAKP